MSRLIAAGCWGLACSITLLHAGCRIGYELLPQGLGVGGAGNGGALAAGSAGDDPGPHAGVSAGGSQGGGPSGGADDGTAGEPTGASGEGGAAGQTAGMAGDGGTGAGGEPAVGSLPPLPCAAPLVWWTDFSSDPTALDDNGDSQPDFVIRGGEAFVPAELESGVWRPTTSKALDTFPLVNFTGRTQARVSMRDTTLAAPGMPSSFGGALFWFNLDYQPSGFIPVFSSITTLDGASYDLGVFGRNQDADETLAGPYRVPNDAFIVVELDFDPASGAVSTWVDGAALPTASPNRQPTTNQDQFATVIAPQGTGEFDELWVATCTP